MTYQVNEIFTSIQGEGVLAGSPATFIRLQGCTVGCSWCDSGPLADEINRRTNGFTTNTWGAGGTRMSVSEIVHQVKTTHVVITGGEPTMYNLDPLIAELRRNGAFVQLETSGLNSMKGILWPDWITWSPKPNLNWDAPEGIKFVCREVKWVVDEALLDNKAIIQKTWTDMLSSLRVEKPPFFIFMPEGCPPREEMIKAAVGLLESAPVSFYLPWRFGDRLQYRAKMR